MNNLPSEVQLTLLTAQSKPKRRSPSRKRTALTFGQPVPPLKEKQIKAAICRYLATQDIFHWVELSGGVLLANGRRVSTGKGRSDIIGLLKDGRFLAIETKTKTNGLTPAQAKFLDNVRRSNGIAIVARCVEDVRRVLEAL